MVLRTGSHVRASPVTKLRLQLREKMYYIHFFYSSDTHYLLEIYIIE